MSTKETESSAKDKNELEDEVVKLVSSDGFEFIIEKKRAFVSKTLRNMLDSSGPFVESVNKTVVLNNVRGEILEEVCKYMHYYVKQTECGGEVEEFKVNPPSALELLIAADFLNC